MDLEQIAKKLDWLDEERRRDKNLIASLQDRIAASEGNFDLLNTQIKGLSTEIARLTTIASRIEQFDEAILQQRVESKKRDDEIEKQLRKTFEEGEKVRRVEMRALDSDIAEVRKGLEPIGELKRTIHTRIEYETRANRELEELRSKIEEIRRSAEESSRTYRLIDEGRRQDAKRVNDLVGEVTAVRKRSDEQRAQVELNGANTRKLETRVNELQVREDEMRDSQQKFIEQQALWQVERDRAWKEMQARFDGIEQQAGEVSQQLQTMESVYQLVKRSQESIGSLAERVERRINEITEIQRLGEDRFRQEWVTFKADDQKRWTNYTLSQEEIRSETLRQIERMTERLTVLEDQLQELHDHLHQQTEQTEKRLQSLLAMAHDWVSSYEKVISGYNNR